MRETKGTRRRTSEPDEADIQRALEAHRQWFARKQKQGQEAPPAEPPAAVAKVIETARLRHEVALIDSLMAYWRAQDEGEIGEYTMVWLAQRIPGSRSGAEHGQPEASAEKREAEPRRTSRSINDFMECWRAFARSLFESVVSAYASKARWPLGSVLDTATRVVSANILKRGGTFDRLLKQTTAAAFQPEAAAALFSGYGGYLTDLEYTIDQALMVERARFCAIPPGETTTNESLLQSVLVLLDQVESPVILHTEATAYPPSQLADLISSGILRETARGLYGVAEENEYFDPLLLTEEDVRQYEVSLPKLVEKLRKENSITGTGFENDSGLIALGTKPLGGIGLAWVYLSLPNGDEQAVLARGARLRVPNTEQRAVLLLPGSIAFSPEARRILSDCKVEVLSLMEPAASGSLALNWAITPFAGASS